MTRSFSRSPSRTSSPRRRRWRRPPTCCCTPPACAATSRCAPAGGTRPSHWFEQSLELARAMPGVVPMDSICWLPWALAAAGRRTRPPRALAEARALPDLARFHSRPVIVAAAEALLAGDADGIDAAHRCSAPDRCRSTSPDARGRAPRSSAAPARDRWLREALDLYEAAGAPLDADRVRQAAARRRRRGASAAARRRRRRAGRARRGGRHGPRGRGAPADRQGPAQRGDRRAAVRLGDTIFVAVRNSAAQRRLIRAMRRLSAAR